MSLPEPIIALLASFQPVFTNPSWQKALVLLVGTLTSARSSHGDGRFTPAGTGRKGQF